MASIQKRGDSYTFRVSAGYDANGKQVMKTMTWKPPAGMNKRRADKEAKHEAELFEEKVRNGMVGDGRMKLAEFAEKWMRITQNLSFAPEPSHGIAPCWMTESCPLWGTCIWTKSFRLI